MDYTIDAVRVDRLQQMRNLSYIAPVDAYSFGEIGEVPAWRREVETDDLFTAVYELPL